MSALLRNRSDLVPILTTLLVGSVLVVAARTVWPADPCAVDQRDVQGENQGGSLAVHVSVLSSTNKNGVLAEMACRFEDAAPTIDGLPIYIVIQGEPSGGGVERVDVADGGVKGVQAGRRPG